MRIQKVNILTGTMLSLLLSAVAIMPAMARPSASDSDQLTKQVPGTPGVNTDQQKPPAETPTTNDTQSAPADRNTQTPSAPRDLQRGPTDAPIPQGTQNSPSAPRDLQRGPSAAPIPEGTQNSPGAPRDLYRGPGGIEGDGTQNSPSGSMQNSPSGSMMRQGNQPVMGTVRSMADDVVTLEMPDGRTQDFTIPRQAQRQLNLQPGTRIAVTLDNNNQVTNVSLIPGSTSSTDSPMTNTTRQENVIQQRRTVQSTPTTTTPSDAQSEPAFTGNQQSDNAGPVRALW